MIIVNGFQPLTIIAKRVAAVLDAPLVKKQYQEFRAERIHKQIKKVGDPITKNKLPLFKIIHNYRSSMLDLELKSFKKLIQITET